MLSSKSGSGTLHLIPTLIVQDPSILTAHDKVGNTALHHASAAGELKVFDESGKAIPFEELYNTEGRTVVVFIRHFFCGVSAQD